MKSLSLPFGCVVALSVLLAAAAAADHRSYGNDSPSPRVEITPSPCVDEQLFLLRLLERMYVSWPVDCSTPDEFVAAVADLRRTALKFQQHAIDSGLDPELPLLFADFVGALDAYTNFLANIGKIEREAAEQANRDNSDSGLKAGMAGGLTYAAMMEDYSTPESASAAVLISLLTYIIEDLNSTSRREEAVRQAVAREAQRVQDKITAALMRAQSTARTLTARHGWRKGEAGFELNTAQDQRVQKLLDAGDVAGLVHFANEEIGRRPRDPFIRLMRNIVASFDQNVSSAALLSNAQDCLEAATLIPAPPVYDEYRTECLAVAALLATAARTTEIQQGAPVSRGTEASRLAIDLWSDVADAEPADPTGDIRQFQAIALMDGNELAAANQVAADLYEVRKSDPDYWYLRTCLHSHAEEYDLALQCLSHAIALGYANIVQAKYDPHLEPLRRAKPQEFESCIRVTWRWEINWGWFNDDIVLYNDSPFPITNVHLSVRLEQDQRVWTPELSTDVIDPGQSYTWKNVVSIPGGRLTKSEARLSCDQNR